ncbi:MAG: HAMP domain-containing protein [Selenomonadaceae bacterium]|nr:HAMP domain-containing protein [Selenomonadaceae bacterium]
MWSRNKWRRWLRWFSWRASYLRISTKITILYAAILVVVLFVTNIVMAIGLHFSFYHQAERELEFSMRHTMEKVERGEPFGPMFWHDDPVLSGVVLRITDSQGHVVLENDSRFPPIQAIEAHIRKDPPFWANERMQVSETPRSSLYYAKVHVLRDGEAYDMHFFKTITAEKEFLATLLQFLFVTNIIAFLIALAAGYFLSNRTLAPIRAMTQMARRIEVERMDRRIEVPPVRDEVTELADTFNHMLDRLQAGFRQQQQFVSDASHELRTPVTVILGYADLLSRWGRQDKEVLDESIESIRSEAEDMQKLIEKLLFLARADRKRQVLRKEPLEFAEVLDDVMKKLKLVAREHTVELLQNDKGTIFADQVMVRQMLRIFLDNSLKYTPKGGRITAQSRREGEILRVTLADNGIGIAPEHQQKVFERFYRVDSSRTKAEGGVSGTGLGLSIASWIAEQHQIKIHLESALGEGTKIHLEIPLGTGNSSSPQAARSDGRELDA